MCVIVLFIYLGLFVLGVAWVISLIQQSTNTMDNMDAAYKRQHSIQYMHEKFLAIADAKRQKAPKTDVNEIPKPRW